MLFHSCDLCLGLQALAEAKQDLLKARDEHTQEDAMLARYIKERDQAKKCPIPSPLLFSPPLASKAQRR